MGKSEYGTPKHISGQLRRRGLQRTKFYCQVCEKQCLDENGFKCHIQSQRHIKNLEMELAKAGNSAKNLVDIYSDKFVSDFIKLLRISHGEKMVGYNKFYQEYILNKDHVHLNATKWKYLTSFIMYLKESGLCHVEVNEDLNDDDQDQDDVEKFRIGWIDNSPEAMLRKKSSKERVAKSDAELSQRLLEKQILKGIERTQQLGEPQDQKPVEIKKPNLKEHGKVKISIGSKSKSKTMSPTGTSSESASSSASDIHPENPENKNKNEMKPIMKCGVKIIPTDLTMGTEGSFMNKPLRKTKLKLKSRVPQKVTSGNVFKGK
ncbi:unnamed protein product [Ambrosiozyma monospora]|uniref:Unnamed protein product n=1 Tax=Ambrosiozyma monospora TaxID=43982 RepID=A0ACB5SZS4_AMBMO|nr:unnamed protein product [Ambrosiozyma monospora]